MADIALNTAGRVEIVESFEQFSIPAAEAVVSGAPVRLVTSTGKVTNSNATTDAEARCVGIYATAQAAVAGLGGLTVVKRGVLDGYDLSGLDYGADVWLSDTDGRLADTAGTINVRVGIVIPGTATTVGTAYDKLLYVDIDMAEDVSLDSLTVSGTTTLNGNVVLGNNAAADTVTITADTTAVTGSTIAAADADAFSAGGVILPQYDVLSVPIGLHASKVIYNLMVAREAIRVVNIDYTPDIAQGGALTATVVKATGTATPASATTPMHIAAAINLNGTAHTVQPITLTATTADLALAAGERIGLVLSGAMTTGEGTITIRYKRV